jgi:uncharacterized membrane protein
MASEVARGNQWFTGRCRGGPRWWHSLSYLFLLPFFALAGFVGVAALDNWNLPLRLALCLMFMIAASAHWGRGRPDLIRMVPTALPAPGILVTITGLLEIAGAVGLLLPQTACAAATCLAVLLIALFPANVRAAPAGFHDPRAPGHERRGTSRHAGRVHCRALGCFSA